MSKDKYILPETRNEAEEIIDRFLSNLPKDEPLQDFGYIMVLESFPKIEQVIFNNPATIIKWTDGTKTVVKVNPEYDRFDPEKGLALAIAKKFIGDNKSKYYNIIKGYVEQYYNDDKE